MPVFQDWDCAALVCRSLDEQLGRLCCVDVRILLVDDGSPDGIDPWPLFECQTLVQIDSMRLRRNLGHQRAICTGLCYIHDHVSCDAVLVMDADGEDRPEDAIRLIEFAKSNRKSVLFAERRKRQEGMVFRTGYSLFRILHRVLTGIPVRVGNFSIVPFAVLRRLACMPELWNHYAGAVYKSKSRFECIPIDRGRRLLGRSRMNLTSLVVHGIAGIATFNEIVATRILISSAVFLVLLSLALFVIVGIRLLTNWAIAGWATYTTGLVLVLAIQIGAMSFSLVFTLISNRSNMAFVPSRDYSLFVDKVDSLSRLG
jgi:glycosyltransferase involved in cell wall biosynthesis